MVAGTVIAGLALPFSAMYLWFWPYASEFLVGISPLTLTILIPLNAFLVTTVVWSRFVTPTTEITLRRLGATGAIIGVLSHLTLGLLLSTTFVLWDENGLLVEGLSSVTEIPVLLGTWAGMGVLLGIYSIPITLGIPIMLSAGAGIAFARAYRHADGD